MTYPNANDDLIQQQPAGRTLWRSGLAITAVLAALSMRESLQLAEKLGVAPLSSKTWLALLALLGLVSLGSLVLILLSFSRKALPALPSLPALPRWLSWAGMLLFVAALLAYPLILSQPYYAALLAKELGMRMAIFWLSGLLGAAGLRLARPNTRALSALLVTLLLQAVLLRLLSYLPDVSTYPFATGWSETSRFYYPALFLSQSIFGKTLAWPILHPTLHFLLTPPYLFGAPLVIHRLWQVLLRFALVGLIAPALLRRVNISSRALRWLVGAWVFLILFTLPLYLHLAVPVLLVLWGYSAKDRRRTWVWLLIASVWAGLSRLNWYPVPAMLAAALYLLEKPQQKLNIRALLLPAAWFVTGGLVAFLSMQGYILLSGIGKSSDFFTSLSSSLLWYRLWPNATYSLGVLPGILLLSIPFWLVLPGCLGRGTSAYLLLAELLALFLGGIVVSMKIGGGGDIHNMDAYVVLLLITCVYAVFRPAQKHSLHWELVALLVLVPAWFSLSGGIGTWQYDPAASQKTLSALQAEVDTVNQQGGEILFITQRHLISMDMLHGVNLVPEYEREELMEMAMAQNEAYLQTFHSDMEKKRFAAIIVDPLRFNYVGEEDAMGAENNAWTRYVVKKILCSYQQSAIFPADRIAIYTPQVGPSKCP